jgi:hypothetical protein
MLNLMSAFYASVAICLKPNSSKGYSRFFQFHFYTVYYIRNNRIKMLYFFHPANVHTILPFVTLLLSLWHVHFMHHKPI